MTRVGAYEAKTHLSRLLDRVATGERIIIERHGVPVAVLQPVEASKSMPAVEAIAELKRLRKGRRLAPAEIRDMIHEGRRR